MTDALAKLGYKSYHMKEVFANFKRNHMNYWREALTSKYENQDRKYGKAELEKLLEGYTVRLSLPSDDMPNSARNFAIAFSLPKHLTEVRCGRQSRMRHVLSFQTNCYLPTPTPRSSLRIAILINGSGQWMRPTTRS